MTESPPYAIRLYVTGRSAHAGTAMRNLEVLQRHHLPEGAAVDIVDLAKDPQLAENEKILATPMLVRLSPEPVRKIVGDLSDLRKVCQELQIPLSRTDSDQEP